MGLFKKTFLKKENVRSSKAVPATDNKVRALDKAKYVADMISNGIEEESFENVNKTLDEIYIEDKSSEILVFNYSETREQIIVIIMSAILTCSFLGLIYISISTLVFSNHAQHITFAATCLVISIVAIAINIISIIRSYNKLQFKKRFSLYSDILKHKGFDYIRNLASFSNAEEKTVVKDLLLATDEKLIPQGHFSRNNTVFMISDNLYNQYLQKPAVYDRYFNEQLEEQSRISSRTTEIKQIIELGNEYIQKINDYNALIKNKAITQELNKMERVVTAIFHEIDINPKNSHSLGLFLNSYLPTTAKLLEAYISINEKDVKTKNLSLTKKEIEEAICKINDAFDNILDRLYQEQEIDVISSIEALEIVMAQEGNITTNQQLF